MGGLLENLAKRGTHGGENFATFLRVGVVRYLGVIFTPTEPSTSGTVSSTRRRPCRSLGRGFNAEASPRLPTLRSQWQYSWPTVTIGGWR